MIEQEGIRYMYATLVLRGKYLDPRSVTEELGIIPSRSFKRGDRRTEAKKWPHGYWALTSSGNIESMDLALHLQWLIDQLEPVKPTLVRLLKESKISAVISCFWTLQTSHDGLSFNYTLLGRIAALGLNVEFDVYCPD